MRNDLETTFAGLTLQNPIIIGSSGLTNTVAKNKELEKAGAGAIILKSLFEEQISSESFSLLSNNTHPEAADYVSSYFKSNEVNSYLKLISETKQACSIPVIASINCFSNESWIDFARQIEIAGADALELNIFLLNTDPNQDRNRLEDTYIQITSQIAKQVKIPVIVKLSKYSSSLVHLINDIYRAGVAGVVLFNRFYQPDIDIHTMRMNSGHVFSSPSDISDTLRWTGIVTGSLPQVPIAASTGVHDWEDVIKCILAGARAVEICSTVYQHGNVIISQMIRTMKEWMLSMQYDSIEAFRGKLNYDRIDDPSFYERIQFMKYFSDRD